MNDEKKTAFVTGRMEEHARIAGDAGAVWDALRDTTEELAESAAEVDDLRAKLAERDTNDQAYKDARASLALREKDVARLAAERDALKSECLIHIRQFDDLRAANAALRSGRDEERDVAVARVEAERDAAVGAARERIDELLNDNNRILERARKGESEAATYKAIVDVLGREIANSLNTVTRDIRAFQAKTFPEGTAIEAAKHMQREVKELIDDIEAGRLAEARVEVADVVHLVVAVADKLGMDLASETRAKLAINNERKWNRPDADGVIEHVREGEGQ